MNRQQSFEKHYAEQHDVPAVAGSGISVFGKENMLTILRSVLRDVEKMDDDKGAE